jgi:hypothetical protein
MHCSSVPGTDVDDGAGEQGGCRKQEYRLTTSGRGTVKSGKCIIARAAALELEHLIHQLTRDADAGRMKQTSSSGRGMEQVGID